MHTDVSPVLAQTFTEPFVVFSAKRFPGVPGMCHSSRRLQHIPPASPHRRLTGLCHMKSRHDRAVHRFGQPRTETPIGASIPSPQSSRDEADECAQRNRNGSSKQGRKRRRDGSDVSGDESDEA